MLVLTRQRDQTIMIGDDIEITVVDIRGDKVRLGITAPSTVPVHRKEVYEAIKRENEQAAQFNSRIQNGDLDVIRRAISPGPPKTKTRANPSALTAGAAPSPQPAPAHPAPDGRRTA